MFESPNEALIKVGFVGNAVPRGFLLISLHFLTEVFDHVKRVKHSGVALTLLRG